MATQTRPDSGAGRRLREIFLEKVLSQFRSGRKMASGHQEIEPPRESEEFGEGLQDDEKELGVRDSGTCVEVSTTIWALTTSNSA